MAKTSRTIYLYDIFHKWQNIWGRNVDLVWKGLWSKRHNGYEHDILRPNWHERFRVNTIQNDAKKLKNDWNPGIWVLTWEYSVRAIQWIPTWQGLDVFQKSLLSCTNVLRLKVASALEGLNFRLWSLFLLHISYERCSDQKDLIDMNKMFLGA